MYEFSWAVQTSELVSNIKKASQGIYTCKVQTESVAANIAPIAEIENEISKHELEGSYVISEYEAI